MSLCDRESDSAAESTERECYDASKPTDEHDTLDLVCIDISKSEVLLMHPVFRNPNPTLPPISPRVRRLVLRASAVVMLSLLTRLTTAEETVVVPPELTLSDFVLVDTSGQGQYRLLEPVEESLARLAEFAGWTPDEIETGAGLTRYRGAGLIVGSYEYDGEVFLLRVQDTGFFTTRGVYVGSTREELIQEYGDGGQSALFSDQGEFIVYQVVVADGEISEEPLQTIASTPPIFYDVYSLGFALDGDTISEIVINIASDE